MSALDRLLADFVADEGAPAPLAKPAALKPPNQQTPAERLSIEQLEARLGGATREGEFYFAALLISARLAELTAAVERLSDAQATNRVAEAIETFTERNHISVSVLGD